MNGIFQLFTEILWILLIGSYFNNVHRDSEGQIFLDWEFAYEKRYLNNVRK